MEIMYNFLTDPVEYIIDREDVLSTTASGW